MGMRLVEHFRAAGEVLAVDQYWGHAPQVPEPRIEMDLTQALPDAPELGGATIVHAAGLVNVDDRRLAWESNVNATFNVLDWAVRHAAVHVILFSTGDVYSRREDYQHKESDPVSPNGIFGHSKQLCERIGAAFTRLYDLPVTAIRLFFPYGPGQTHGLLPDIARAVRDGRALPAYRDGGPVINPVHIDDIVTAVDLIAGSADAFRVFNICGDESISYANLVRIFEKRFAKQASFQPSTTDLSDLLGDNALAKSELGWRPRVSLTALEQIELV